MSAPHAAATLRRLGCVYVRRGLDSQTLHILGAHGGPAALYKYTTLCGRTITDDWLRSTDDGRARHLGPSKDPVRVRLSCLVCKECEAAYASARDGAP